MTREPIRRIGRLVPHQDMCRTYEARSVPYRPTEHVAACTNCQSREHAPCVSEPGPGRWQVVKDYPSICCTNCGRTIALEPPGAPCYCGHRP